MVLCGVSIGGFSLCVLCDIVTRTIGRPWLWLQEVTSLFFVYGSFHRHGGGDPPRRPLYALGITESLRRGTRMLAEMFNRVVVLTCGLLMVCFG